MTCSQTLISIANDCAKSLGGLRVVYIANYDDIQSLEVSDGKITGISMVGGAKFKKFEFRKNTASMTSTFNVDATNGTSVSTDVSLSFLKQETQKRLAVNALAIGDLVMIVMDANGLCWYLGKDFPVNASAGGAESGTAYTDSNRYTITLQDTSLELPFEVKTSGDTTGDNDYVKLSEIVE